jgi:hypothetical protein
MELEDLTTSHLRRLCEKYGLHPCSDDNITRPMLLRKIGRYQYKKHNRTDDNDPFELLRFLARSNNINIDLLNLSEELERARAYYALIVFCVDNFDPTPEQLHEHKQMAKKLFHDFALIPSLLIAYTHAGMLLAVITHTKGYEPLIAEQFWFTEINNYIYLDNYKYAVSILPKDEDVELTYDQVLYLANICATVALLLVYDGLIKPPANPDLWQEVVYMACTHDNVDIVEIFLEHIPDIDISWCIELALMAHSRSIYAPLIKFALEQNLSEKYIGDLFLRHLTKETTTWDLTTFKQAGAYIDSDDLAEIAEQERNYALIAWESEA